MNKLLKGSRVFCLFLALLTSLTFALALSAAAAPEEDGAEAAAEATEESSIGMKAIAAGVCIGIAAAGGAVGMGLSVAKSAESVARQPEAEGKVRTTLMLGLVFIETAIIYALLAVILIIFVL